MLPGFTSNQNVTAQQVAPQQYPASYGNWCGLGRSGPEPPIDDLDACCMSHDNCYGTLGYFNCVCDTILCGCVLTTSYGGAYKAGAQAAIAGYFCNPAHPCTPIG